MRGLLGAAILALSALASAASSAAAPATMRLDANYDARAFYRPQLDCVMFTRNVVPFCKVCQRALEQVINLYAGPRRAD